MASEDAKRLAQRFIEAMNRGDLGALDAVIAPDYQHHDAALPPEMQHGLEAYKGLCAMFLTGFPDLQGTIEDMVTEGDKVVSRITWKGSHKGDLMGIPATGRQVIMTEISIQRVANGKITEGWVEFNALGMMQQVGAIPTQ